MKKIKVLSLTILSTLMLSRAQAQTPVNALECMLYGSQRNLNPKFGDSSHRLLTLKSEGASAEVPRAPFQPAVAPTPLTVTSNQSLLDNKTRIEAFGSINKVIATAVFSTENGTTLTIIYNSNNQKISVTAKVGPKVMGKAEAANEVSGHFAGVEGEEVAAICKAVP